MKGRVIFLLEEPPMKILLERLLPRPFPGWVEGQHFQCVPHQGKSDLDLSIPRKLAALPIPGDRFVIVRDNDHAECIALKARFTTLCATHGRPDTLVRLVCQELESWYVGDLKALAQAFNDPKLDTPALRKRFASPDGWQKLSVEVQRLVPSFQKCSGARRIAACLHTSGNRSPSFQALGSGLQRVAQAMGYSAV